MARKKPTPRVREEIASYAAESPPAAHTTVLSARDWELFTELMDNPPPPNEALKRAARHHRDAVVRREDSDTDG